MVFVEVAVMVTAAVVVAVMAVDVEVITMMVHSSGCGNSYCSLWCNSLLILFL